MMTEPIQLYYSSILQFRISSHLAERECFRSAEFVDFKGSSQPLNSSHLRERNKMLSRAIWCGGVWNGFVLGQARKEEVPCRFCGGKD